MVRVAFRSAIMCLALWGTTASGLRAQPTQLDTCGVAECRDFPFLLGAFVDCPGYDWLWFGGPVGREWWGPLRYTGPIQVSLQIAPFLLPGDVRAPLLLQVRTDADAAECRTAAGTLLWSTYAEGSCPPDSLWETSPLFDLATLVGLGNPYWIQVEGTGNAGHDGHRGSPLLACLRVRAFPIAVTATHWGTVKSLYK